MKLYRYMSLEEFSSLTAGVTLENNKKWSSGYRSTSKGFCFLPEWAATDWEGRCASPVEALSFLTGIVPPVYDRFGGGRYYLLVELECMNDDFDFLIEGEGRYAVPFQWGADYYDCMNVQEYSCTSYSRNILTPTRYAIIFDEMYDDCFKITWYDTNIIPDYVIGLNDSIIAREDEDEDEEVTIKIGRYKSVINRRRHH